MHLQRRVQDGDGDMRQTLDKGPNLVVPIDV